MISVILPTYCRGGSTLRRAVESVLGQTFADFELIVIDDGSRDGTLEILREYQRRDPRVVLIRHRFNSGLPALRVNEGILLARGRYVSYQFDDDEWLPDCLENLYRGIMEQERPCLVYGSSEVTTKVSLYTQPCDPLHRTILGRPFNYGMLLNTNYIANNSVLHPKNVFLRCGLYDPHVLARRFSDYDLWLRMAKVIPFVWIERMVSRVFAGERHSLGNDVDCRAPHIFKYLEIPRARRLLPEVIGEYQVDGTGLLSQGFNQSEVDELLRFEIVPYRQTSTCFYTPWERKLANVSRSRTRTLAVIKGDFSTSVDETLRNYTHRITGFPYRIFFLEEKTLVFLQDHDYDLLLLYQTMSKETLDYHLTSRSRGRPVIYLMEDNLFKSHESKEEFAYPRPNTSQSQWMKQQFALSDAVFNYNFQSSRDCTPYNRRVTALSTNLPGHYLKTVKTPPQGRIRYAILSGPDRPRELALLWPALQAFARRHGKEIEFHFWGVDPFQLGELDCPVTYRPFNHSYDVYLDALAASFFHYHLYPLEGSPVVLRSESPIGFWEGTVAGAVGIFSTIPPYDALERGTCFQVTNDPESWLATLEMTLGIEEETRHRMYVRALEHIWENHTTESQVHCFLTALEAGELHARLRNKKIAYFFHESHLGDATLQLFRHAKMAQEQGFDIRLCSTRLQEMVQGLPLLAARYGLSLDCLSYVCDVKYFDPSGQPAYEQQIAAVEEWLKVNVVGLVHSVTYNPIVGKACKNLGIPHVATLRQYYAPPLPPARIRLNPVIDMIHSSSNRLARLWSSTLGVPARGIYCPVDERFFTLFPRNAARVSEARPTFKVLLSGTLGEINNQRCAIMAFGELKERGYSATLDLIGCDSLANSYVEACRQDIARFGLENQVRIHGFIEDPIHYYDGHTNILLCASNDESTPQALLQAMAAGVLVVTTDAWGVKEIIKDNYNGVRAEDGNPEALANALVRAMEKPAEEKAIIMQNAWDTARMVADPCFVSAELFNLYNEAFLHLKQSEAFRGRF